MAQNSPPAWTHNPSFHKDYPLQLAWDSTSISLLKTCPRKYQLSLVEGWEPKTTSCHLVFGQIYHKALETYDHFKFQKADHATALREALRCALTQSWDQAKGRPWQSFDPNKNRLTLIRTVVWYLEEFSSDPFQTDTLADGKPAVELSFRLDTQIQSWHGDPFILCGHIDRIGTFQGKTYILDRKTTKSLVDSNFFSKFSPDNQFSLYTLASKIVYSKPVSGLIVDGAQIAVTFSRFARQPIYRTDAELDEWWEGFTQWLQVAQIYAKAESWPMNESSCGNYGGCQFRSVCSKPPSIREEWLKTDFQRRIWNPLEIRGDI